MSFPFYCHFVFFRLTKAHPLNPLELAQSAMEGVFEACFAGEQAAQRR